MVVTVATSPPTTTSSTSRRRPSAARPPTSSRRSKRRSLRWTKRKQGPREREQRQRQQHRGSNSLSADHQTIPFPAATSTRIMRHLPQFLLFYATFCGNILQKPAAIACQSSLCINLSTQK